jgi:carboxymethylenebutenolidase
MIEFEVDVETSDGLMNTVITHPEEGGPFPLAICFIDSCGVRPDFLEMARRLAVTGYCVATPNMYYRKMRNVDLDPDRIDFDDTYDDGRALMWELNRSISLTKCASDTIDRLTFMESYAPAIRGPIGAFGYCLGGRLALAAAAFVADRIGAAASFHGGGFVKETQDSIHLNASKIQAEVYIAHAGTDKYVPEEQLFTLNKCLEVAGVRKRIEIYRDAHHGFAISGRRVYHEPSANRAWERLFALFRRNLPQAPICSLATSPKSGVAVI